MSLTPLKTVGHPTQRIDAVKRVTGTATYTGDIQVPGMLYARVLRSPHAHARIRKIDTSKAQALPGVKAVLTGQDLPIAFGILPVSHAAMAGQYQLEQTFLLAVDAMQQPERSPLRILERIKKRALV